MSSSEVSHARTSATPATEPDSLESVQGSGLSICESFASFDLATSSWKTSQLCLSGDLDEFSGTWPEAGSMRNGRVYQRAAWVRHTCDSDCSLWPTPTASMDGRGFGIPLHERSGRYKKSTVSRVQELVKKHGWRIHPNFTEALMGFDLDASAIAASETPSLQTSLSGSPVASSKRKQKGSPMTDHGPSAVPPKEF